MTRSQDSHQSQAFDLLATFLETTTGPTERLSWLPTAGTLPHFSQRWGGHSYFTALTSALRSLGQVIFINNPISGLLLLLALLGQSPAMGLFSALGVATANLTAKAIGCDRGARCNGIYGFNGALVGSAAAAFRTPGPLRAWLVVVAIGAALTTLLLHHLGRWLIQRLGLPPLTLPFCLVTWLMLTVVMALHNPAMDVLRGAIPAAQGPGVAVLLLGVVRGFGQVFLCPSLLSGLLVLGAVAAGSPLAALIGLAGGLVSSLSALALGMAPGAIALGLGSYNGVLTAIAIGGTFYATTRGSVLIALVAGAGSSLVTRALGPAFASAGLPLLTLPFIVATLATMVTVRRALPSLLPVALHSVLTPEEHRQRFVVATSLLSDFRRQLHRALSGERQVALLPLAEVSQRQRLQTLFAELDRDGSGTLSLAELTDGLRRQQPETRRDATSRPPERLLEEVLEGMDLDGDGQVDAEEFAELMLRLRRLHGGRERLLTYLQPVDADGNDRLEPAELDRLLSSVGQPRLTAREHQQMFGLDGRGLSWESFIDRLLLT
ncbi:MAG: urea transporter [Cyanobium sp. CZS 25K]|nr:urea transporter [Cyanobium sp. CZS25K]